MCGSALSMQTKKIEAAPMELSLDAECFDGRKTVEAWRLETLGAFKKRVAALFAKDFANAPCITLMKEVGFSCEAPLSGDSKTLLEIGVRNEDKFRVQPLSIDPNGDAGEAGGAGGELDTSALLYADPFSTPVSPTMSFPAINSSKRRISDIDPDSNPRIRSQLYVATPCAAPHPNDA
jgi:hypothetical protein